MKNSTFIPLLFCIVSSVEAVQVDFSGNFIYVENSPLLTNPISAGSPVSGFFNFDELNPASISATLLPTPESLSVNYSPASVSISSPPTSLLTNNVQLTFLNDYHIDHQALVNHGLSSLFPDDNYGDWDIVSLSTNYGTGIFKVFAIYDKSFFSPANFNNTDFKSFFDIASGLNPKFIGLEAIDPLFHGAGGVSSIVVSRGSTAEAPIFAFPPPVTEDIPITPPFPPSGNPGETPVQVLSFGENNFVSAIPEPEAWMLMMLGMPFMDWASRVKKV